jgi:PEP-CTERM motif
MKLQQLSTGLGLVASSAIALSAIPTQAASFTVQDATGCVGSVTCTVNGFALTASKKITQKTVGGISGLGVAADASDPSQGEIDRDETLKVLFPAVSALKELQLSHLYQPGVYADRVFEKAQITALDALGNLTNLVATLTVTGNKTAEVTSGDVTNISPSLNKKGGSYLISDLFGDLEIGGFILTALSNGPATSFRNSDFTLTAVATTVPEPGTLTALLGVGVIGGLVSRRRTKAA